MKRQSTKRFLLHEFDSRTNIEFIWERKPNKVWHWIHTKMVFANDWKPYGLVGKETSTLVKDPRKLYKDSSRFKQITEEELFSILL